MKKTSTTVFTCQNCGHQSPKWLGKCPECGEWNSLVEERATANRKNTNRSGFKLREVKAVTYAEIESHDDVRTPSGVTEFDRVLGGGIVAGTLVLIGGDPGIGKSTLLLQVADKLSSAGTVVLYISGEESERQIKLRGERLKIDAKNLYLLPETNLENIFHEVERLKPGAIIVDSIQTVFSALIESAPGSVSQVREVAHQFLLLAKNRSLPVFLIGHITKDGALAGPKSLEHIVDTVLYFEGERYHSHRIVRTVKNRFGAANELGIFEMTNEGLIPVDNPSKLFLSERPAGASGSVVIGCVEGSRPILVELQALVSGANYASPRRMAAGVDPNRVSLLLAMLDKRLGVHLGGSDVYVNVAGGLTVDEPAADLGIVASIVSSFRNRAIAPDRVIFGEVGLAGEVRATSQTPLRIREAASMGFKQCILPYNSLPKTEHQSDIELIPVRTVQDAMEVLFD
jgi:DNA repair protein RadA/Sms